MPPARPQPCYSVSENGYRERYVCCQCTYTTRFQRPVPVPFWGPGPQVIDVDALRRVCGFRECRHHMDDCRQCMKKLWVGDEGWACWACAALSSTRRADCYKCGMRRVPGGPLGYNEDGKWRKWWIRKPEHVEPRRSERKRRRMA